MFWKISQLLISLAMIFAGLSGEYVLRGTNSSPALVVFGFGWLAYDIYNIVVFIKMKRRRKSDLPIDGAENLTETVPITIVHEKSSIGSSNYIVSLNGEEIGTLKKGKSLNTSTLLKQNKLIARSLGNESVFCFTVQEFIPAKIIFKIDEFEIESSTGCTILTDEQIAELGERNTEVKDEHITKFENHNSGSIEVATPKTVYPSAVQQENGSIIICSIMLVLMGLAGFILTIAFWGQCSFSPLVRFGPLAFTSVFIIMGIGTLLFSIFAIKTGFSAKKRITFLVPAATAFIYSLHLINHGINYRSIYLQYNYTFLGWRFGVASNFTLLPLIINIVFVLSMIFMLLSLRKDMGKAGRVLTLITIVVFGVNIHLWVFISSVPMRRFYSYGSHIFGYLLCAATLIVYINQSRPKGLANSKIERT